ncbi:protein kinase domain-containing protein [Massilia sp. GER05]|uniref:class III lanthionine synthetase LanKC N-terminal domain-containing protein n=1 Tax=Massilia sp. GER05 TaxID=3394605 RepID=UPI003F843D9E
MNWSEKKTIEEKRWAALTAHLQFAPQRTQLWKSFRGKTRLPPQGWKIHVSAHVFNACDVFEHASRWLERQRVSYKTVADLNVLSSLNAGIQYGYSQIGKFITAYPEDIYDCQQTLHGLAVSLAEFNGPRVPNDHQLAGSNCIFFRYGAFSSAQLQTPQKKNGSVDFVRGANGRPVRDRGRDERWLPRWLALPAQTADFPKASFIAHDVLPFLTLARTGKGSVYKAMDIAEPLRPVTRILKQGLRGGGMDWSRIDGAGRLLNEMKVCDLMSRKVSFIPRLNRSFQTDSAVYGIFEYIDGCTLDKWLRRAKPGVALRLSTAIAITKNVVALHDSGLAWRDLKFTNILIKRETRDVYFIDFEGAVEGNISLDDCWGSPTFVPPEFGTEKAFGFSQDIFALGKVLDNMLSSYRVSGVAPLILAMMGKQEQRPMADEVYSELLKHRGHM